MYLMIKSTDRPLLRLTCAELGKGEVSFFA